MEQCGIHVPDYEHFDDLIKQRSLYKRQEKDMSLNLLHFERKRAGYGNNLRL